MRTLTPTQEFLAEAAERFDNNDPTGVQSVENALLVANSVEERRFAYYALATAYHQVGLIYLERFVAGFQNGASERMQQFSLRTSAAYLKRAYERFREVGMDHEAGHVLINMSSLALAAGKRRDAVRLVMDANRLMYRSPVLRPPSIILVTLVGIDKVLSRLIGRPAGRPTR